MSSYPYTAQLEYCIGSGGFIGGRGEGGGWEGLETPSQMYSIPPTGICLDDTNFINILIFRVRPCAYYMKAKMKSIYSKFI